MPEAGHTAALIVAAGQGTRAGLQSSTPKQYLPIGGVPILLHALRPFLDHDSIATVQVVIGHGQRALYNAAIPAHPKLRPVAIGGATRQASVRAGLTALSNVAPERVLIHDGARPFASATLIDRVVTALSGADAVVPTLPIASTLKRVTAGRATTTVPRDQLEAAETPQGFAFRAITEAHDKAAGSTEIFTDDAAVAEWAGIPVLAVAGESANIKLTTAADIAAADRRLTVEAALRLADFRVGVGYDVHTLGAGDHVMLGGVLIPHTRGIVGHSDADVVLHALTDAVLGAIGDGDIGQHFPPTDMQWKGAPSSIFLADAVRRVRARGGVIANLDVAYVGQGPRISTYREEMRARIAEIAGIAVDRVGVKATTNEGLGFIGRGEGVSAHAVATVRLPLAP